MKKKLVWYVAGVLILGLALLAVSCGGTTTAPAEEETAPPAEEEEVTPPAEEEEEEGSPNIPAGHAAAGCPVCHEQGIGDASQWPDNHASFTEEMCASCHKPAQ